MAGEGEILVHHAGYTSLKGIVRSDPDTFHVFDIARGKNQAVYKCRGGYLHVYWRFRLALFHEEVSAENPPVRSK